MTLFLENFIPVACLYVLIQLSHNGRGPLDSFSTIG